MVLFFILGSIWVIITLLFFINKNLENISAKIKEQKKEEN